MRSFVVLAALFAIGCGASVEGVRVSAPESKFLKEKQTALKGKIGSDDAAEPAPEREIGARALATFPFPIEPPDTETANAEIDKLERANGSIKTNWVPPGQDDRWGHASVLVHAPLDAVRAQVTDFAHLKDLAPQKFKTSRIVDKHGSLTDVYLQIPVLKGLITLWQVVRFAPAQVVAPGLEVVHGTMVKGNVKRMRIVVTMRAIDANRTVLTCDLLLVPEFFAPQVAIDEELRDAAQNAVDAVRDRAEHR
jgi:hypothetical protein